MSISCLKTQSLQLLTVFVMKTVSDLKTVAFLSKLHYLLTYMNNCVVTESPYRVEREIVKEMYEITLLLKIYECSRMLFDHHFGNFKILFPVSSCIFYRILLIFIVLWPIQLQFSLISYTYSCKQVNPRKRN